MVIKIDLSNNSFQTALKKSISWEINIKKNELQEKMVLHIILKNSKNTQDNPYNCKINVLTLTCKQIHEKYIQPSQNSIFLIFSFKK